MTSVGSFPGCRPNTHSRRWVKRTPLNQVFPMWEKVRKQKVDPTASANEPIVCSEAIWPPHRGQHFRLHLGPTSRATDPQRQAKEVVSAKRVLLPTRGAICRDKTASHALDKECGTS